MFKHKPAIEIDAVLDEDLNELLENLNIKDDIIEGKYKCSICNKTVTVENIGLVIPKKDKISFICDEPSCLLEFAIGE